ncbi:MAG: ATP-binding protein, partial [Chloroflexota bacterium]
MNNQSRLPNPFHLEGDPINGRLFVGRQSIFDWLSENQNNQDGTRILLLMGEPQIGKTSLLQQLRNSQDSAEHKSIYVNCHTLNSTSISQFLFSFTKSILEALNFINLPAFSNLRQADFVAKPFKKLGETLREIENHVDTAKLIYLIDNFDGAWSELADTDRPESIIAKLNKQLNTTQFSQFILTTLINPIWYSDEFESFKVEEIPSLSPSETAQLFRLAMRATIVDDVAKYIHALTDGKPILLHKIGHALFEWQQSANIQQLTRSDVAKAALDIDLVKPTELSNFQPSPVITKVGRFRPFSPIQMAGLALGLLLIPLWMLFSFGPADAQIEETSISFANQPTETENLANLAIEPTIELENISTSQTETPEPLQDPSPTVEPTLTNT